MRTHLFTAAAVLVLSVPIYAQDPAAAYDIVIRNGSVLDGAGNPWILADVAIKDGKFVRVGRVPERGKTEIDARGKYVSPGWIDVMDQSGSVLRRNPLAENKLMMGATSVIAGEGGTPVSAGQVKQYFQQLERQGISVNFGTYFSETQARNAVMGNTARAPTPAELDRMRAIVDTAMRAGVMGMTTALIYPPSSYATTDELVEVAKAAAVLRDRGVWGRFAIYFISVREGDAWKHYAIGINLRKGGTTYPFLMLEFLLVDDRLLDALGMVIDRCAAVSGLVSAPGHGTPTCTQDRFSVANTHINRYTQHRSEPPRSKVVGLWCAS